jgi:hypothetical protein
MSSWICRVSRLLPQLTTILQSDISLPAFRRYLRFAPVVLILAATACGGGSGSSSSSDPKTPPAAGPFNSYIGTSPFDATASAIGRSGTGNAYGVWDVSFDHTNSGFSVFDVTTQGNNTDFYSAEVNGSFAMSGGFLSLTQTNDPLNNPPPAGVAFEIPGRVAILRQGDPTIPVTALVPTGCPSIAATTKFNFVVLPTDTWAQNTDAAYGSLSIAADGSTWTLTSYQQSTLAGAVAPNSRAKLPPGTCAATVAGTAVFVPSDPTLILPKTIAVGPSGFYIADQGEDVNSNGNPGQIGVMQPSSALTTSDVLSHQYLGFTYEPGADAASLIPETQMASFSASSPAGQLVGGVFPNDDPTQLAATNLVINLGTQDATTSGLYPNVVITNQFTGTTYPAIAVVGNPGGKYAIFIIGEDMDYSLPIGIYLFQK